MGSLSKSNQVVQVVMPRTVVKTVDRLAKKHGKTRSQMLAVFIRRGISDERFADELMAVLEGRGSGGNGTQLDPNSLLHLHRTGRIRLSEKEQEHLYNRMMGVDADESEGPGA